MRSTLALLASFTMLLAAGCADPPPPAPVQPPASIAAPIEPTAPMPAPKVDATGQPTEPEPKPAEAADDSFGKPKSASTGQPAGTPGPVSALPKPTGETRPPGDNQPPSTGRALGNAVRRAFGIPAFSPGSD